MNQQYKQYIINRATELFNIVWGQNRIERLSEFYSKNVIGHYKDEVFGYNDIHARFLALHDKAKLIKFEFKEHMFIHDTLVFRGRQLWQAHNKVKSDAEVIGAYRFENDLIVEMWIMSDQRFPGYRYSTENNIMDCASFDISIKDIQSFWQRVQDHQELYGANCVALSKRESDVLYYFIQGYSSKEIGIELDISPRTAETHIKNIKEKYQCCTRRELKQKLFPR